MVKRSWEVNFIDLLQCFVVTELVTVLKTGSEEDLCEVGAVTWLYTSPTAESALSWLETLQNGHVQLSSLRCASEHSCLRY